MKRRILVTGVAVGAVIAAAVIGALGSRPAKHQQQQAAGEFMASPSGGFVSLSPNVGSRSSGESITLRPSGFDISPVMRIVNLPAPSGPPQVKNSPEPSPEPIPSAPAPTSPDPIVQRTNAPNVMPATTVTSRASRTP